MAHGQQQAFVAGVRERFPDCFGPTLGVTVERGPHRVLDVGSVNVNGDNRDLFGCFASYIGCDVVPGKNVDLVSPAHMLTFRDGFFDTIISTECLEHDMHWRATLANCYRMLAPRGLMVLTCAGPGRPEHGTTRTSPSDAPGLPWPDYYRNLSLDDLREVLTADMFSEREFDSCVFPADSYFWGIKR